MNQNSLNIKLQKYSKQSENQSLSVNFNPIIDNTLNTNNFNKSRSFSDCHLSTNNAQTKKNTNNKSKDPEYNIHIADASNLSKNPESNKK